MEVTLSKRSMSIGLKLFILLTLVGFTIAFYLTTTKRTLQALDDFDLKYFLLAFLLTGVDFLCGSFRIHIFVRKIIPKDSFWSCFRANLANIFMAAVTPFQTGGGPAQLYILTRAGVPLSGAVSVSVMNFVATLFILFASAVMIMLFASKGIPSLPLRFVISISSISFYVALAAFILFLFRPSLLCHLISWWRGRSSGAKFTNLMGKVQNFILDYQNYITYYWKNEKGVLIANILLTIILYFNKCFIAFVVLLGMGFQPNLFQVITIQLLLIFLFYFCPTPGASLVAETTTSAVIVALLPVYLSPIFTVLWRFFTTYIGVGIGGIILLREIGLSVAKET